MRAVTISAAATGFVPGSAPVTVTDNDGPTLTLALSTGAVDEGAGVNAATGTVSRNTTTSVPLTVTLSNNVPNLQVPATVTIPAGATAANFVIGIVDDNLVTGTRVATIGAAAPGFNAGSANLTVSDNDSPSLTLSVNPSTFSESAGTVVGTVRRNTSVNASLMVQLSSSDPNRVGVPAFVTIPAGADHVDFQATVVDDTVVTGDEAVTLAATANGLATAIFAVTVTENDQSKLNLSVSPTSFSETAGARAATATVTRNFVLGSPLTVSLASSIPSAVTVPHTVVIPAGEVTATFPVSALDDHVASGTRAVTITATANGVTGFGTVTITDNDRATLTLSVTPNRFSEAGGHAAAHGVVTRNTPTTGALVVDLSTSDGSKAQVPATVTIPAGAASASFAVSAVDNDVADGPELVTFSASADGLTTGTATVTVVDNEAGSDLTLGGHVTVANTTQGVGGATAQLFSGSTALDITTTSANGLYQFTHLPISTYTVRVSKDNYRFAVSSRSADLESSRTDFDFAGTPLVSVSGRLTCRLTDGTLQGLVGVTVFARDTTGTGSARTDATGHYVLTLPRLGAFVVAPSLRGTDFTPRASSVTLTAAQPAAVNIDFVASGTDTANPTATVSALLHSPVGAVTGVRGTATDAGGAGLRYVTVALARFPSPTATTATFFWNWSNSSFISTDDPLHVERVASGTSQWTLADLPTLPAGFYGVRATATDGASNTGHSTFMRWQVVASTVRLSTLTLDATRSSLRLRFTAALDAESAADTLHYRVTVNGHAVTVESAAYEATTHNVILSLPDGTLTATDHVAVAWDSVLDAQGRVVNGSVSR